MKISEKVYMHILVYAHFFNEIPTGLHNSLNLRPESLTGEDDNLPVHVGHYL